jgi:hypothetical protein
MVRSMIKTKEIPKKFWTETVQCMYKIDVRMHFSIIEPPRTLERTQTQCCTSQGIQEHSIQKNSGPEENQVRRQKQEVCLRWIQ